MFRFYKNKDYDNITINDNILVRKSKTKMAPSVIFKEILFSVSRTFLVTENVGPLTRLSRLHNTKECKCVLLGACFVIPIHVVELRIGDRYKSLNVWEAF